MTSATDSLEQLLPAVLRETWDLFKNNALTFAIAALLCAFISGLTLGILAGPLFVGFIDLVRRARRGEAVQIGEVFNRFDSFGSSVLATFLLAIAIAIGCSLLVLPGLLVALFGGFTLHVIAYDRASAFDSIKRSIQIVRQHFLPTLAVFLTVSVVQAIGGGVLLGVVLTLPLGLIAVTVTYERLASQGTPDLAQVGSGL